MNTSQLIFLHLSDIHFKTKSDLDPDIALQKALIDDAEKVAEELDQPYGVLVTGDIAFSGHPQQYETAKVWLQELCDAVGIGIERVRTIPGNHDVDRSVPRDNYLLAVARDRLRQAPNSVDLNASLTKLLQHPDSYDVLMAPTRAYNEFAGTLGCAVMEGKLWWEEDFNLNDGSTLRIRGLHSALTCDDKDTRDMDSRKMILGSAQMTLKHQNGVAHLVMCHHPFDWMRFEDEARETLNAYASVQLFGHKHRFNLDTLNGQTLHLSAGAIQPDADDPGWEPRYNFLGLSVEGEEDERFLQVEIWPRIWNKKTREFVPDYMMLGANSSSSESKVFKLRLKPWRKGGRKRRSTLTQSEESALIPVAPQTVDSSNVQPGNPQGQPLSDSSEESAKVMAVGTIDGSSNPPSEAIMQAKRKLAYVYLNLPYLEIMQIASSLSLLHEEDRNTSDQELYKRIMARADQNQQLGQLWDEVSQHEALPENPFRPSPKTA